MTFPHLLRAAPFALVLSLVASACSGTPAPPQAYAYVTMKPSVGFPGQCVGFASQTAVLSVGTSAVTTGGNLMEATRVATGAQQVQINCTIKPEGTGYSIDLNVAQSNTASLTVHSTAGTPVDPANGGTKVVADVTSSTNGDYHYEACTITFNTPTAGSPSGSPLASGRIWAHLSCDGISRPDVRTGAGMPSTCDAEADLIFENCGT